ncbi:RagB/SusD family nutrient uptake outer membrane protein [Robertkochia flava]|uniref:RagB/SusD family nutrient uptake outer membrane protein n=1 Tax=Robertkochia flava TaxID=3447986 RepID=UPI001CCEA881|nr:RagB/SusD family nutrient uptake outer membrane protein [Robertkochia marina]
MKKIIYTSLLSLGIMVSMPSCETDFDNPNAPNSDLVLQETNGLLGSIVGLEYQYSVGGASSVYTSISGAGFSAMELTLLNAGNAELAALLNGGSSVAPSNSVVTNLWTNLNLVRSNAQKVIDNAQNAAPAETADAIRAYGLFYKALSIGTMTQFWENVTVETGVNQEFVSREQGLQVAVSSLQEAASLIGTQVPANVLNTVGNHIDLPNAIQALIARYQLMLGNHSEAIAAASVVDRGSTSVFIYDNVAQNPVFRSSLTTNNVYDVLPDFGLTGALAPDPADGRIAFYLEGNEANGKGFFTADEASIPIYVPGEMDLIIAEAHAREGQAAQAVTALDVVRTKTGAEDAFGLGAGLSAYTGATDQASLLTEIYKNRCIEMYMSGLKLEDSRRFGRPGPGDANAERNRNWYPYPNVERDKNTNTPTDPQV